MVRNKLKQAWGVVPQKLKHVIGFLASATGFLLALTTDDDEKELSDDTYTEMYLDEKGNVTYEPTPTKYDPWGTRS